MELLVHEQNQALQENKLVIQSLLLQLEALKEEEASSISMDSIKTHLKDLKDRIPPVVDQVQTLSHNSWSWILEKGRKIKDGISDRF